MAKYKKGDKLRFLESPYPYELTERDKNYVVLDEDWDTDEENSIMTTHEYISKSGKKRKSPIVICKNWVELWEE